MGPVRGITTFPAPLLSQIYYRAFGVSMKATLRSLANSTLIYPDGPAGGSVRGGFLLLHSGALGELRHRVRRTRVGRRAQRKEVEQAVSPPL